MPTKPSDPFVPSWSQNQLGFSHPHRVDVTRSDGGDFTPGGRPTLMRSSRLDSYGGHYDHVPCCSGLGRRLQHAPSQRRFQRMMDAMAKAIGIDQMLRVSALDSR